MQLNLVNVKHYSLWKNNGLLIILSSFIFILTLLLLTIENISERYLIIFVALPFLLLFSLNFNLIFSIFILSFFYESSIYYFSLPLILLPIVIFSFVLNYSFQLSELKTPVFSYLTIFLISILPSYLISYSYMESWLLSYNILAYIAILLISIIAVRNFDQLKKILFLYLFGAFLSSSFLIFQAIFTGKRAFGVSGVMFVDLIGIAIVLSYSYFLFYKNKRTLYGMLTFVLITALIFTQTRNSWISTGVILSLLTIQFIIHSRNFGFDKSKSIKRVSLILVGMIIVVLTLFALQPEVFKRITESEAQTTREMAESIDDIGSLSTRFFIWHTALNAFTENPVFGIGYHSFRFISEKYSTWDSYIYYRFIRDLPPHTTILAILAETGLVGALGFLTFMFFMIRFARKNYLISFLMEHKIHSFTFFWCFIYICISMVMTDAWLWGTLHMLWAVLLGMSVVLRREIKSQ